MVRPLRIQYPGALYHVTNRGNERKAIFKNDDDRLKFLEILAESLATYSVKAFSFALMPNHFHLLVETPLGNLSEFMRHFNITYTSYFNRMHRRVGHLYQGRYKSVLVDSDEYLVMVSCYIHLNPVKVGKAKRLPVAEQLQILRQYNWSSLPGFLAVKKRFEFIEYATVLESFGGDTPAGRKRYTKQIAADLAQGLPMQEKIVGQCLLGSEDFINRIQEQHLDGHNGREQPAIAQVKRFLAQDDILDLLSTVGGVKKVAILHQPGAMRQMAMDLLYRYAGMTNPAIGKLMGVDYSTVSQGRKRFREALKKKSELQGIYHTVEQELSRIKI